MPTMLHLAGGRFFVKIPGATDYMNIRNNFSYGNVDFNDGALINGADDNNNTTGQGDSVHCVTFGTASVANGEYVIVKMEVPGRWNGKLNQITFQLGASDVSAPTEAPALDDIDANNSGVSDAKLSFGASNTVTNYSNATGSSIGLTDFNSNALYSLSGDRRGVLGSLQNITGELNEDVAASSPNYTANAFKNAYTGSLVLVVNGAEVHTLQLSSSLVQSKIVLTQMIQASACLRSISVKPQMEFQTIPRHTELVIIKLEPQIKT